MKLKEFVEKYGDVEITDEIMEMFTLKNKKVWMPEDGKKYWFFDTTLLETAWAESILTTDDLLSLRSFSFKSKEECDEYIEHLKTKTELQMWIAENDYIEDYNELNEGYTFIPCGVTSMKLYIGECELMDAFEKFIFSSAEKCEKAIEAIGEDRIYRMLKYRRNWF